jgi:hypothetical protein
MSSHNEGLLNDVAVAIGATLGRVTSTATDLVETARKKVSGQTPRKPRKAKANGKTRTRRVSAKRSQRASHAVTRARKAANVKAGRVRGRSRRSPR